MNLKLTFKGQKYVFFRREFTEFTEGNKETKMP